MKFWSVVALCLVASVVQGSEIRDKADIFFNKTREECQYALQELEKRGGPETMVFTIKSPEGYVNFKNQREKDKFFEMLIEGVGNGARCRGIVVLICMNPGRVQVDFHSSIKKGRHDKREMDKLRDIWLAHMKKKDYSGGLDAFTDAVVASFMPKVEAAASIVPAPINVPPEEPAPVQKVEQKQEPEEIQPAAVNEGHTFLFYLFVILTILGLIGVVSWVICYLLSPEKDEPNIKDEPWHAPREDVLGKGTTFKDYSQSKHRPSEVMNYGHPDLGGGIDPLSAGILGYSLGASQNAPRPEAPKPVPESEPKRSRQEESRSSDSDSNSGSLFSGLWGGDSSPSSPSYDSPSYDSGSSGGDFGGSDSGSFDGGSGGDF